MKVQTSFVPFSFTMPSIKPNGLSKVERLSLKRSIDALFQSPHSFISYPLRVVCLIDNEERESTGQILISVSKRYHKHAVNRNRIKRLIREAYRLNKATWLAVLEKNHLQGRIAFIYVSKEILTYQQIEKAMHKALKRLIQSIESND